MVKIKHNDHFYCINLDSRPDRWKHCLEQFRLLGISDIVIRIPGVDFHDKSVQAGRAGCTAALFKTFEKALQNQDNIFTIFEDDVIFYPNTIELINNAMDTILQNNIKWDMVFWGCRPRPEVSYPLQKTRFKNLVKVNCAYATHAMTFNSKAVNEIFSKIPNNITDKKTMVDFVNTRGVSDVFLKKELISGGKVFCPNGLAACQISDFSDIDQRISSRNSDISLDFYKYLP